MCLHYVVKLSCRDRWQHQRTAKTDHCDLHGNGECPDQHRKYVQAPVLALCNVCAEIYGGYGGSKVRERWLEAQLDREEKVKRGRGGTKPLLRRKGEAFTEFKVRGDREKARLEWLMEKGLKAQEDDSSMEVEYELQRELKKRRKERKREGTSGSTSSSPVMALGSVNSSPETTDTTATENMKRGAALDQSSDLRHLSRTQSAFDANTPVSKPRDSRSKKQTSPARALTLGQPGPVRKHDPLRQRTTPNTIARKTVQKSLVKSIMETIPFRPARAKSTIGCPVQGNNKADIE